MATRSDLLENEFNAVVKIHNGVPNETLPLDTLAKLWTWQLTFKTCVFIESSSMILENCDELFENDGFSATCDANTFVCKPSFRAYRKIFRFLQEQRDLTTLFRFKHKESDNKYAMDAVGLLQSSENGSTISNNINFGKIPSRNMGFNNGINVIKVNVVFSDRSLKQYVAETLQGSNGTATKILPKLYSTPSNEPSAMEGILSKSVKIVNFFEGKPWMTDTNDQPGFHVISQFWKNIFAEDIAPKMLLHCNLPKEIKDIIIGTTKFTNFDRSEYISKDDNDNLADSVAVIGLSCRFPGANNTDEFWKLLLNGQATQSTAPFGRWNEKLVEMSEEDYRTTQAGFLKCPIDEFDSNFFGISPREASFMDPQQRILLEVAWESLENAGINPQTLTGTNTGVFIGICNAEYGNFVTKHSKESDWHRFYLGNAYSATSARISFFLGLIGPNIAIESGCSSSFVSLHLACESLRKGDCKLAMACGVNLLLHPFSLIATTKSYFLAADGRCKTFDAKADGFGRAEGCGVVVLKRFADAVRDGDNILGCIRGSAMNTEGTTASFGTPSKKCQEMVIKEATKRANVDPGKISYVEAHGTGTPVGDPIEISAMVEMYSKNRTQPLLVGSVKTNIGHTEGAAGIAGLIKVLLALKNNTIPPHCNFESLNPDIPLDKIPAKIPLEPHKWERVHGETRLASVSSFSVSGTNVHAIIQEPPITRKSFNIDAPERPLHLLTLSAKNERAMNDLVGKYQQFFKANPDIPLSHIAYAANVGRAKFSNRLAVVGKNSEDALAHLVNKSYISGKIAPSKQKLAFLFTGQGSQYVGMGKELYDTNIVFKMALDKCENILKNKIGFSILEEIFKDKDADSNLDQTLCSQTSIFCIEYGLFQLWNSFGVKPDFVFGHSVGEFAAATAAGIMNVEDALHLLSKRSQLIQNLPPGGMLAVKTSVETVQDFINKFNKNNDYDSWVDIAVVNSVEEVVIAGKLDALSLIAEYFAKENINTQKVAASHAFHSREMNPIMESFGEIAKSIPYETPTCGYVSGRDGRLLQKSDLSYEYWQNHARETVNFPMGLKTLRDSGCTTFVEIGPHPVLLALGLNNLSAEESMDCLWLPTIRRNEEEWQTVLSTLGKLFVLGLDIDFKRFDCTYTRKRVDLPTYPFQRQRHWFESTTVPNGLTCNTKTLHPLIGRNVPVATSNISVNIYQQSISLQKLPYLADHMIANRIIMPGAGFLEMVLAVANLSMHGDHDGLSDPKKALIIENFLIETPLELIPDKCSYVQTTSCPNKIENKDQLDVTIFKKTNNLANPWKKCVTASVNLGSNEIPTEWKENVNLNNIRDRFKRKFDTDDIYRRCAEAGVTFGPTFQSIKEFFGRENEIFVQILSPPSITGSRKYICHPIIMDAMFQAHVFQMCYLENAELYLPVLVEKFTWLPKRATEKLFIHFCWKTDKNQTSKGTMKLMNEFGELLCVMEGDRLVKTSLGAFVNVLNSQNRDIPRLLEEVFRPKVGPLMSRINLENLDSSNTLISSLDELTTFFKKEHPYMDTVRSISDRLLTLYFIKALQELGWNPVVNEIIELKDFMTALHISNRHERFTKRILSILCEDGILENIKYIQTKGCHWKLIKAMGNKVDTIKSIEKVEGEVMNAHPQSPVELPIYRRCSNFLSAVLQDQALPLSVLFVEEPAEENATRIYSHSLLTNSANRYMQTACENIFSNAKPKQESGGGVLRILEIGAGTGSTTEFVFAAFKKISVPFYYTFTDISQTFLTKASEKFKDINRIAYKILNIEEDPKSQGFGPHMYDLVICSNVIHATANISQSLRNIRHLMAPGGYFMTVEMFKPNRSIDFIFGILEGFWKFTDTALRPDHPFISIDKWQAVVNSEGFVGTQGFVTGTPTEGLGLIISRASSQIISYHKSEQTLSEIKTSVRSKEIWIIFGSRNDGITSTLKTNFRRDGENVIFVSIGEKFEVVDECEYSLNPLKQEDFNTLFDYLCKNNFTIKGTVFLWSVGATRVDRDVVVAGLLHYSKCTLSYIMKAQPRLVVVSKGMCYTGDEEPTDPTSGIACGMLFSLKAEQPGLELSIIDLDPCEDDLESCLLELYNEIWTNCNDRQVAFRQRKRFVKRIVPLKTMPAPIIIPNNDRFKLVLPESKAISDLTLGSVTAKQNLSENEMEIRIIAAGLNFRDIFVIIKPDGFNPSNNEVGIEFSGVVTAVGSSTIKHRIGDEVFGLTRNGGIATHTVATTDLVMRKPQWIPHTEAATMPIVFVTAYGSLVEMAKINSNDTVLIHVASGGVGLAALQVCRQYGSKIIATAGSRRKRAFLRSLGVKHVFHSRNTNYSDEILAVTDGAGVDVVLNSLTAPNFKEATLRICKPNARFIELSKMFVWTAEEVKELRPDVSYTIIDMEPVLGNKAELVESLIFGGVYTPLPYTRFDVTQTKEAYDYFQKAHHIGKVVVTVPQVSYLNGTMTVMETLFNEMATYLITGGLGGIGLEVAKFMFLHGAKNLVLIARSVPNAKAEDVIKGLKSKGANIVTKQVDVGNYDELKSLFDSITSKDSNLPDLRGVMHAAGIISDGVLANQTMKKFQSVFNAKVEGVWNLHNLTRNYNLEHFVIYSSAASFIGPLGQANHAAANSFLDTFAHYRHALGLPVQTINWGIWSEVGAASELALAKDGSMGFKPFPPAQGLAALKVIMKGQYLQIAVTELDVSQVKDDPFNMGNYIEELVSKADTKISAELVAEGERIWREIKEAPPEKRAEIIKFHQNHSIIVLPV